MSPMNMEKLLIMRIDPHLYKFLVLVIGSVDLPLNQVDMFVQEMETCFIWEIELVAFLVKIMTM